MRSKAFIAALLTGTMLAGSAGAETIEVTDGGSIQSAINRAGAGDVVLVAPGTYSPFQINRDGVTVRSAVPGGAHVVARGRDEPAIAAYGQNNIVVQDFRITSQGGDGVKIGGNSGRDASNITFAGNTVETAALDGLKFFQAKGLKLIGNTIRQAGTARNGNGDGGIDFVGVDDSTVQGNKVERTFGAACLMMKGGSDGNTVTGNALMGCEKDGVTVGGFTDNKFMDRSDRGMEAHNNTITGNQIQAGDGKCGFYYHEAANNRVSGNQVIGGRADCSNEGGGAKLNLTGTGSGAASSPPFSGGLGGSGLDSVANNVNDTGEEFWSAVERGEAGALYRLNDLVSGGVLVRQGNQIVNRATGQVTSTIGREINGAVDAAFAPVENGLKDMANEFVCKIGGGWASALIGINLCASKQLSVAGKQLKKLESVNDELVAMNAGTDIATDGTMAQIGRSAQVMGQGGFLAPEATIAGQVDEAYPNSFAPMPPNELLALDARMSQQERRAISSSFRTQNHVLQEQVKGVGRSAQYASAGRAGEGVRSELQAANAIQVEQVAAINGLTSVTAANERAAANERMRAEATRKASNAAAETYMSTLGECGNCTIDRPFLSN